MISARKASRTALATLLIIAPAAIAGGFNTINDTLALEQPLPKSGLTFSNFGQALATHGDLLAITSRNSRSTDGRLPAAVYLYDIANPKQPRFLRAIANPTDTELNSFGFSLALNTTTLLTLDNRPLTPDPSALRLHDLSTGDLLAEVQQPEGPIPFEFRGPLAITDNLAIVGVSTLLGAPLPFASAVAIYDITDPAQPSTLSITLPSTERRSLFDLSIEGDLLCASVVDDNIIPHIYSVLVYDIADPANPTLLATITPPPGSPADPSKDPNRVPPAFGFAIDLDGERLAVGSPSTGLNSQPLATAYLYDLSIPASPTLLHQLNPQDAPPTAQLGYAIDLDGDALLIGAPGSAGQDLSGAAYLFDANTGEELATLKVDNTPTPSALGSDIALINQHAFVSALGVSNLDPNAMGRVHLFDLTQGDLNNDNAVSLPDLNAVLANFGATAPTIQLPTIEIPAYDESVGDLPPRLTLELNDLPSTPDGIGAIVATFTFIEDTNDSSYASDLRLALSFDNQPTLLIRSNAINNDPFINPDDYPTLDTWVFAGRGSDNPGTYRHRATLNAPLPPQLAAPLTLRITDDFNGGYTITSATLRLLPPQGLPGDANNDGVVDLTDLSLLLINFGR